MYNGFLADIARVQKIMDWLIYKSLTKVQGFLGIVGTICIFIKNYAIIACSLVHLTCKNVEFVFGKEELVAIEKLKELAKDSPVIRAIDYTSGRKVVLAVDTSYIAIGYILS